MGQAKVLLRKRFVATRMDQKPRKKLQWLWPEWIALGTLTVLAGGFGTGKSLLAADLAARVSRGDAWPDGRPRLGPSQVLMLNHDDHPQYTSDDMLQAAGADMAQIASPEEVEELGKCGTGNGECGSEEVHELEVVKRRPINLTIDLDALEEQLAGMENCRLVIIDPIDAHLSGGNSVAARMWLRSLMVIAAKYQVAMVLLTHLKDGRKSPLYRLMGGMGLAGAARSVWMIERDPKELSGAGCQLSVGQKMLLLQAKNNLSGERTGLAFRLVVDEERGVPRVEWSKEVVTETVEEVMEQLREKGAKPSYAVRRAMEFLQEALADGPKLMREVVKEAKEREGISRSSLERARKEMKVRAFRKVVPGAWWICLKEYESWRQAPIAAVEDVEGIEDVEGLAGIEGLGFDELIPGEKGVGEGNAENAEGAENVVEGVEGVEGVESLEGVEGLLDVE